MTADLCQKELSFIVYPCDVALVYALLCRIHCYYQDNTRERPRIALCKCNGIVHQGTAGRDVRRRRVEEVTRLVGDETNELNNLKRKQQLLVRQLSKSR